MLSVGLEELPDKILHNKNLSKLSLRSDKIGRRLNLKGISELTNLKILNLSGIFENIEEIFQLPELRECILHLTYECTIPNSICLLDNLYKFEIYYNNEPIDNLYWINDTKATVSKWNEFTKKNIPETVIDLKILNCEYKQLNDLPIGIEFLRLGPSLEHLINIPCGLKKVYVEKSNGIRLLDTKLPWNCEIIFGV